MNEKSNPKRHPIAARDGWFADVDRGVTRLTETCTSCNKNAGYTSVGTNAAKAWREGGFEVKDITGWFGFIKKPEYARLARLSSNESGLCRECWRSTQDNNEPSGGGAIDKYDNEPF